MSDVVKTEIFNKDFGKDEETGQAEAQSQVVFKNGKLSAINIIAGGGLAQMQPHEFKMITAFIEDQISAYEKG